MSFDEQPISNKSFYQDFVNNMADWIWEVNVKGIYTFAEGNTKGVLGYNAHELIGKSPFDFMPEDEVSRIAQIFTNIVKEQSSIIDLENWNISKSGDRVCLLTNGIPFYDKNNNLLGYRGIDKDITEKKRAEDKLLQFKNIFNSANEAIVITNLDGNICDINLAYETITGYSREEVIGNTPAKVKSNRHDQSFYQKMWHSLKTEGCWEGEIWDRRKNGEIFPKWLSINTIYNVHNEANYYVGFFSDISEKKVAENKLIDLAYFDPLTKLLNRSHFRERLLHSLEVATRRKDNLILLFIDLDRFKDVNDTFGHTIGDLLLIKVAKKLKKILRNVDTIARIGGDEFTVILSEVNNLNEITSIVNKIINSLCTPFFIQNHEIMIAASIGIATYPDDGIDVDTLISNADAAMYCAKSKGGSNFQFFSEEINQRNQKRSHLEKNLRRAIKNNEFELYYQPQIDIINKKVTGAEALIRWNDPHNGLISPIDFIPVAEETGMIIEIGAWVCDQICQFIRRCLDRQMQVIPIAMNLSAVQFRDGSLISMIRSTLKKSAIATSLVELEITESAIMENTDQVVKTLKEFRDMGFHISIDDFGTGYSSLAYLKKLPIDKLKIDREFIRNLPENRDDIVLTTTMINLAKNFSLEVLAEGVETEEQINFLHKSGCRYVQGFYHSKPLPEEKFIDFLSCFE
jgi:diguanylate cyclase (GGDEF)-like protein/PAS domain S-box-containing protein